MHRSFHAVAVAALALALPVAASAQTNLNLDTGATGTSGGDIAFSASGIAPVGAATLYSLTSALSSEFSVLPESALAGLPYSTTPIGSGSLSNDFFAVHTNGGNYAKVLVTAVSSSSITLQYVTYNTSGTQISAQGASATLGGQSGPAAPSIASVLNNYSSIVPNAPNYGIAPGSLIVIYGSNLAAAGGPQTLQDPSKALPFTLSGSSVSVTVNGTTVQPAFYYAFPGQIAVVLPSSTPVGTGTITVSYGGQTSAPAPLKVVASAFGFDYYGGALAAVTDNGDGHLITTSDSAKPNEVIVFWGSGVGANTKNTDVSPPTDFTSLSGITALYFGSVKVPIAYQGRSQYQGVDQLAVVVPSNAPTGCAVSVAAVSGSGSSEVVSNFVALPIATNGGTCVDPLSYVSPTESSTLSGKTTVKFGEVAIAQETSSTGTTDEAIAIFYSISGSSLTGYQSSSQPSYGSCFVTQSNSTTFTNPYTLTGLNAGSVSVTGPNGTVALTTYPQLPGDYIAQLTSGFVPSSGGTFTFSNGAGGPDVGAFTAPVVFNTPLVWTNSNSDGTVTRGSGVTVNWTGGGTGTYVEIGGDAISSTAAFSASFVCNAPVSAGTFTVPPVVLLALPAGSGSLSVGNYTTPASFTTAAPQLDFGYALAFTSTSINATYN